MRATLLAALFLACTVAVAPAGAFVSQPGSITLPVWSPDGTRIAWMDAPMANVPSPLSWQGWVAAADGSHPRLTIHGASLAEGVWQLDWLPHDRLAFFSNFSIYTARLGTRPTLLASNITDEFSTDRTGRHFAYEQSPCGGQCSQPSQIVVINPATKTRSILGDAATYYSDPTLSPSGSQVAFASPAGLLAAHTDGSHLRVLATRASCPQWSPDSRTIAYIGERGSLRVVPAVGGPSKLLLRGPVPCHFGPLGLAWSPNGTMIAATFVAHEALVLINVTTGRTRQLPGFSGVTGVAWSPDSTKLLVAARPKPAACSSLWAVDSNGAHRRLIVRCGS